MCITRMDGCNFLLPDLARGKAYGAAAWKRPSAELASLFGGNTALAVWSVATRWRAGRRAAESGTPP